eukprot:TRINITY_DN99729_c0_g1_i1.p1 TRINITY_DN99729_c0_g1~~TRINITY_DN99729_c0_g1_i1.p1  ORF type:complete len:157 (+),score=24.09 TRINITY_DN99729_c0_g1_i1:137-607(+)
MSCVSSWNSWLEPRDVAPGDQLLMWLQDQTGPYVGELSSWAHMAVEPFVHSLWVECCAPEECNDTDGIESILQGTKHDPFRDEVETQCSAFTGVSSATEGAESILADLSPGASVASEAPREPALSVIVVTLQDLQRAGDSAPAKEAGVPSYRFPRV